MTLLGWTLSRNADLPDCQFATLGSVQMAYASRTVIGGRDLMAAQMKMFAGTEAFLPVAPVTCISCETAQRWTRDHHDSIVTRLGHVRRATQYTVRIPCPAFAHTPQKNWLRSRAQARIAARDWGAGVQEAFRQSAQELDVRDIAFRQDRLGLNVDLLLDRWRSGGAVLASLRALASRFSGTAAALVGPLPAYGFCMLEDECHDSNA